MSVPRLVQIIEESDIDVMVDFIWDTLDRIEGEMWQERAGELAAAVIPALVLVKEDFDEHVTIDSIRDQFSLKNTIALCRRHDMPDELRDNLEFYLSRTPGYMPALFHDNGDPVADAAGPDTVIAQHNLVVKLFFDSLNAAPA